MQKQIEKGVYNGMVIRPKRINLALRGLIFVRETDIKRGKKILFLQKTD
jgi:hypothetical protein